MLKYTAPLRDMRFLLHEVFDVGSHYKKTGYTEATRELVDAILDEAAKFCQNVISPLNPVGDEVGLKLEGGRVYSPKGFKEAYQAYVEASWGSLAASPEYGGQGLPESLELAVHEMCSTANTSWHSCAGLTLGAIHAIHAHASEELKKAYLPKLISAVWSGTMCLTEAHAGTDVGILKTRAEPHGDGSYRITGNKIFITYGEHEFTENIVHLVLARLPDAAPGPKGISLFLVPKFLPNEDGTPGERNPVTCVSIEKKMGIKASPTCVLEFEGAKGWLIGPPHGGLACMFTMMNYARIDVGISGFAQGELAFQGALAYARERLQSRSLTGPKAPDKEADPIIVHPDVRRMLLTQKALVEGCRALAYFAALQLDALHHDDEAARTEANDLLALLTPITKAFLSDSGFEVANLGVQVFGGHGYIRESGVEQLVRDSRIMMIYEGTNGIQALDLMRRKVLGSKGALLRRFTDRILRFCEANAANAAVAPFIAPLRELTSEWIELAQHVGMAAMKNPDEIGAASVDFQQYSSYVTLAYLWAEMARVASAKAGTPEDDGFYAAKLHTARFYYDRILPRTRTHAAAVRSGADNLMGLSDTAFVF
jgi:alkylation response protein AidB-like acyl-CoA dehydrogenase